MTLTVQGSETVCQGPSGSATAHAGTLSCDGEKKPDHSNHFVMVRDGAHGRQPQRRRLRPLADVLASEDPTCIKCVVMAESCLRIMRSDGRIWQYSSSRNLGEVSFWIINFQKMMPAINRAYVRNIRNQKERNMVFGPTQLPDDYG